MSKASSDLSASTLVGSLPDKLPPGIADIGCGYNIFGKFASASSETRPFFDWSKANYDSSSFHGDRYEFNVPDVMSLVEDDYAGGSCMSGESAYKFQQNLSAKLDFSFGLDLFSGSMTADYSDHSLKEGQQSFTRYKYATHLWHLSLKTGSAKFVPEALRNLLFDDVRTLLNSARSPEQLEFIFNQYGSHFLASISLGGLAVQSASTSTKYSATGDNIEAGAKATFDTSVAISTSVKDTTDREKFLQNSNIQTWVVGGDPSLFPPTYYEKTDQDTQKLQQNNWQSWRESIAENPVFVDFHGERALLPIWTLCDSDEQYKLLSDYFRNTWGPRESWRHSLKYSYLSFIGYLPSYKPSVPPGGFERVWGTFGKDADDAMYCMRVKPDPLNQADSAECVIEIQPFEIPEDQHHGPEGWHIVGKRSIGTDPFTNKQVLLCYKTAPYDSEKAIRDILVERRYAHDVPNQPPEGYTLMDPPLRYDDGLGNIRVADVFILKGIS